MIALSTSAFDSIAPSYDATFTRTGLGRRLRRRVWRHLDRAFHSGQRVLDVGCGTGEDALHLAERGVQVLAVDASQAMVEATAEKVRAAGLQECIEVRVLPAEKLAELKGGSPFDGVLSNFGVLNCVKDLHEVAEQLAELTRSGGKAFLCLMGPCVPWEWAWYLARGEPEKAFRRWRKYGVLWRGIRVRYPSDFDVRRAFETSFRLVEVRGLGVLLPPTYADDWASRHPDFVARLDEIEQRFEALPPFPQLADHYLLELARR